MLCGPHRGNSYQSSSTWKSRYVMKVTPWEILDEKKPPDFSGGLEGQGLAFDFIAFGFEEIYERIVERFQIIILISDFDLSA